MRYAFAVTPKNYLLFGCHVVNFSAQATQGYRYVNHWHLGGRENSAGQAGQKLTESAKEGLDKAKEEVKEGVQKIEQSVKGR